MTVTSLLWDNGTKNSINNFERLCKYIEEEEEERPYPQTFRYLFIYVWTSFSQVSLCSAYPDLMLCDVVQ